MPSDIPKIYHDGLDYMEKNRTGDVCKDFIKRADYMIKRYEKLGRYDLESCWKLVKDATEEGRYQTMRYHGIENHGKEYHRKNGKRI